MVIKVDPLTRGFAYPMARRSGSGRGLRCDEPIVFDR